MKIRTFQGWGWVNGIHVLVLEGRIVHACADDRCWEAHRVPARGIRILDYIIREHH